MNTALTAKSKNIREPSGLRATSGIIDTMLNTINAENSTRHAVPQLTDGAATTCLCTILTVCGMMLMCAYHAQTSNSHAPFHQLQQQRSCTGHDSGSRPRSAWTRGLV